VKLHQTIHFSILFITEVTWKTWKALATWILIKRKEKKRTGDNKKDITTLGSSNDDNRHSIL